MLSPYLNSEILHYRLGSNQAVKVDRFVFIAGQTALDENNQLTRCDFLTQVELSLQNVNRALKCFSIDWKDVIQLKIYVVDLKPEHQFTIKMQLDEIFGEVVTPAITVLGVQSLMKRELRVEIEAIAYIN